MGCPACLLEKNYGPVIRRSSPKVAPSTGMPRTLPSEFSQVRTRKLIEAIKKTFFPRFRGRWYTTRELTPMIQPFDDRRGRFIERSQPPDK
jgi:hypothetical protein